MKGLLQTSSLKLSFIDEVEGSPDTWGWYIVDKDGGAHAGPFSMKEEAIAELDWLRFSEPRQDGDREVRS